MRDLHVDDGLLALPHGTKYRLLVLPPLETMRPELLEKISDMLHDGAVVMGAPPRRSPSGQDYPEADRRVQSLAAALWGDWNGQDKQAIPVGRGFLLCGMNMEEALDFIRCVPDCRLPKDAPVVYGHRTLPDAEVYFLANQSNEPAEVTPVFRVKIPCCHVTDSSKTIFREFFPERFSVLSTEQVFRNSSKGRL